MFLSQTKDIKRDVIVKFTVAQDGQDATAVYQHELKQLQRIPPHRHVVGFLGYGSSAVVPYLVFEYCPAGSLHAMLHKVRCAAINDWRRSFWAQKQLYVMEEEELLDIAKQVASGMTHLASLEVVHGSLSTFVAMVARLPHSHRLMQEMCAAFTTEHIQDHRLWPRLEQPFAVLVDARTAVTALHRPRLAQAVDGT